jgi:dTDP-glucose pyrophosphorylase
MKHKPILVVLAAGMGSRYGGLKQMDKIGASGETLLDYSVFDALRSGFGKVVFVIRRGIEKDFGDTVLARMNGKVEYELAFQELDSLIPARIVQAANRVKPWGTAHALLCAEECINAPFAVINADDFYGREAYAALGEFLSSEGDLGEGAIVPYKLKNTLSPAGSVTRGVCGVKDGCLVSVEELLSIKQEGNIVFNTEPDGSRRELAPDTPVSMNFWGFPTSIFGALRDYFNDFLEESGLKPNSECYIPKAVDHLIRTGALACRLINADSEWFGVTYAEDRAAASLRIAELSAAGVYPASLWRDF